MERMAKLGPFICPQNTITYYTMDRYDLHFDFISISGEGSDIYKIHKGSKQFGKNNMVIVYFLFRDYWSEIVWLIPDML